MEDLSQPRQGLPAIEDVVAAGAARAQRGGREVLLPGGMGVALIEELEHELAEEADDLGPGTGSASVDEFAKRVDEARARLQAASEPVEDDDV